MLSLDIGALDSLAGALGACSRACSGASGGSSSAASSLASGGLVGAGGSAAGSSASSLGSSASSASDALAAAGGGARLMARDARSLKASCEAVASSVGAPAGPSSCGTVAVDGAARGLSASAGAVCSGPLPALAALASGMSAEASGLPGGQAASEAAQALLRSCADASGRLVSLSSACSRACSQASALESAYSSGWGTAPIAAATASAGGGGSHSVFVSAGVEAAPEFVPSFVSSVSSRKASEALADVGIKGMGTVVERDGYLTYSGFEMAGGAARMTTRCSVANAPGLARPSAVLEARADFGVADAAAGVARYGGKLAGYGLTVGLAAWDACDAYQREYAEDAGIPEGRRASNAFAEAGMSVGVDAASYAAGVGAQALVGVIAAGAAEGSIAGAFAGPIGIAVGTGVGIVASLVGQDLLNQDFDGDGESNRDEMEDAFWKTCQDYTSSQNAYYASMGMPIPGGER